MHYIFLIDMYLKSVKANFSGDVVTIESPIYFSLKSTLVFNLIAFFRFTDGEESKSFSCQKGLNPEWTPSKVVPDCVSEDTTLSTYDVAAKISYR